MRKTGQVKIQQILSIEQFWSQIQQRNGIMDTREGAFRILPPRPLIQSLSFY